MRNPVPILSAEQVRAVAGRGDEAVRVVHPATNRDYVLIPADVYERVKALAYDSPWTDDEMDRLAGESAGALGWEGVDACQDPPP